MSRPRKPRHNRRNKRLDHVKGEQTYGPNHCKARTFLVGDESELDMIEWLFCEGVNTPRPDNNGPDEEPCET